MKFRIAFNELTFNKQDEIRDMIRFETEQDKELMEQFEEEAKDDIERDKRDYVEHCKLTGKELSYKNIIPLKDRINDYVDDVIENEINTKFYAIGEVSEKNK